MNLEKLLKKAAKEFLGHKYGRKVGYDAGYGKRRKYRKSGKSGMKYAAVMMAIKYLDKWMKDRNRRR